MRLLPLLLLLLVAIPIQAQLRKGTKAFKEQEYFKAMTYLEKALMEEEDTAAIRMLCTCYKKSDYMLRGQEFMAVYAADSTFSAQYGICLTRLLMDEGTYDSARTVLQQQLQHHPSDKDLQRFAKQMNGLLPEPGFLPAWKVGNAEKVNTFYSEFSPAQYKGDLVFTSDRGADLIHDRTDPVTGKPYLGMYRVKKAEKGKVKLWNPSMQSAWHDGPFSLCGDTLLVFTRAEKEKKGVKGMAGLFFSSSQNGKWQPAEPFIHNSKSHSIMHPALSADGRFLFFASDMDGGHGGMDIWYCEKQGASWSKPANPGQAINTAGNDVFPYIDKEGTLYFASDGHPGYGGLDIYKVDPPAGSFKPAENMGIPVNSTGDDFGIYLYDNGKQGYLSSNRHGGHGRDDIYSITRLRYTGISGSIVYNDAAGVKGTKVLLVSKRMDLLDSALTNEEGIFRFENLPADGSYYVLVDAEDTKMALQRQGVPELHSLSGELLHKGYEPIPDVTIKLVSRNLDAIRATITSKKGSFRFERLPVDDSNFSMLEVEDPALNLGVLSSTVNYNDSLPVSGVRIFLANENKMIIDTTVTGKDGNFTFENLPVDKNYIVLIDAEDTRNLMKINKVNVLSGITGKYTGDSEKQINVRYQIVDRDLKTIHSATPDAGGSFRFERLPEDKRGGLSMLYTEDTDLSSKAMISGNLSYNKEKKAVSGVKVFLVDENKDVLATATTDAKGNFSFENLPPDASFTVMIDAEDTRLVLESSGVTSLSSLSGRLRVSRTGDNKIQVMLVDKKLEPLATIDAKDQGFEFIPEDDTDLSLVSRSKIAPQADSTGAIQVVLLETVYYGYDKHHIENRYKPNLLKIATLMKKDPSLKLELGSYTDTKGSEEYNLHLSNRRMINVLNFLVSQGIDSRRITGKGYGETDSGGDDKLNRKTECRVFR